ncbi:MAG: 5'-deoxynucleotidase [Lachnospiraceae bacterium]
MKENQFFALMGRMKYINRWGLMRNTKMENICEHSMDVAMIAHALGVINNVYYGGNLNPDRLALMGMYHDATEIITGDMPTPVKYYNPLIRNAYKEVESVAKDELLEGLPKEMRPFYAPVMQDTEREAVMWLYVKAADKLSALVKCIEERSMGNQDFKKAEEATIKSIQDMKLPEVNFFVEHFIPAYGLTLDDSK